MTPEQQAIFSAPFLDDEIEVKIGAFLGSESRRINDAKGVLFLSYFTKEAGEARLDIVDPKWSDELTVLSDAPKRSVVSCRLTVEGIQREDIGEDEDIMSACARAFKRACSKFGIGRYLYTQKENLTVWRTNCADDKAFTDLQYRRFNLADFKLAFPRLFGSPCADEPPKPEPAPKTGYTKPPLPLMIDCKIPGVNATWGELMEHKTAEELRKLFEAHIKTLPPDQSAMLRWVGTKVAKAEENLAKAEKEGETK